MFELNHLRCFVAVAEELHFGKAAIKLSMTQPPLSRQIQQLEYLLRVKLFERSNRSVRLTPAGRAFLVEARMILGLSERASVSIRRISEGTEGSVSIGFTGTAGYSLLPAILTICRNHIPHVEIILKEIVTRGQLEALSSRQIDLGLLHPPVVSEEFDGFLLSRDAILCAIPDGHRLAGKDRIQIRDLHGEQMIDYSPFEAGYYYQIIHSALRKAGCEPKFGAHVTQVHSILGLVQSGMGIALVPGVARRLHFEKVQLRRVSDMPNDVLEHYAAWKRSNDNPALHRILSHMDKLPTSMTDPVM